MAKVKERKEVSTDKAQAKKDVLAQLNKKYGKGTIANFSEMEDVEVQTIPTGSIGLDLALGRGGYPRGRIVELWGQEAAGKSSLALHAIAEVQKAGGNAAYIDAEQAMDPAYAKALGVNMDEVAFSQPSSGEQALTIVEELVKSNAFDIIIVDSVAALVPQSELAGEIGHSQMGSQARLMSQALRKLTPEVSKSKTVLFFINQVRQKIGVMYGPDTALPGGNALKFYASVRMEIRKGKAIKEGDEVLGNNTHIKIVKNKIAPPFKTADFDILYGKGINRLGELLDFSVTLGIIQKGGAWYSYEDKPIGQGREQAQEYLKENPEVLSIIEKAVYQQYNNKSTVVVVNDIPYDEDGVTLDATVD